MYNALPIHIWICFYWEHMTSLYWIMLSYLITFTLYTMSLSKASNEVLIMHSCLFQRISAFWIVKIGMKQEMDDSCTGLCYWTGHWKVLVFHKGSSLPPWRAAWKQFGSVNCCHTWGRLLAGSEAPHVIPCHFKLSYAKRGGHLISL